MVGELPFMMSALEGRSWKSRRVQLGRLRENTDKGKGAKKMEKSCGRHKWEAPWWNAHRASSRETKNGYCSVMWTQYFSTQAKVL